MYIPRKLRTHIFNVYGGRCAYTGAILEGTPWQVDHVTPAACFYKDGKKGNANCYRNLVPAIRIVNHYKRDMNLEQFRGYICTLHLRLAKLPKRCASPRSIGRKAYLYEVAQHFGISIDTPFNGVFYFEAQGITPVPPPKEKRKRKNKHEKQNTRATRTAHVRRSARRPERTLVTMQAKRQRAAKKNNRKGAYQAAPPKNFY